MKKHTMDVHGWHGIRLNEQQFDIHSKQYTAVQNDQRTCSTHIAVAEDAKAV